MRRWLARHWLAAALLGAAMPHLATFIPGVALPPLLAAVAAWATQGLLLGVGYASSTRWLARPGWLAPHWVPLGAIALVAFAGYGAFWIFFAHALAGKFFCLATLVGGAALLWRSRRRAEPEPALEPRGAERKVAALMAGIGLFYLALLYLFPTTLEPFALAANRFRPELPPDNRITHELAARLYAGEDPRVTGSDWHSSDRPPLQAGWQLLTRPAMQMLGFDARLADAMSALWFQLAWVAALHGLLVTLGVPAMRAGRWIALLSLSGFFLQNTVFTWPKLAAGAFACGAFGVWVFPPAGARRQSDFLAGALFAALAWLAHGGVAFALLALGPWIAWRALRGEARGWLLAAGGFALLALPWSAYQRFYDPPANRLLKWHLAGHPMIDDKSTGQVLREHYGALSLREIWQRKAANFAVQLHPPAWPSLLRTSAATLEGRRNDEFFIPLRALTWWNLGWLALGVAFARRRRPFEPERHAALGAWVVGTTVVWCLLMFDAYTAMIHQGSYTTLIAAFALLCAWCERSGDAWFWLIALLQSVTFLTTWAIGNAIVQGSPSGWPGVLVAAALLVTVAWPRRDPLSLARE